MEGWECRGPRLTAGSGRLARLLTFYRQATALHAIVGSSVALVEGGRVVHSGKAYLVAFNTQTTSQRSGNDRNTRALDAAVTQ